MSTVEEGTVQVGETTAVIREDRSVRDADCSLCRLSDTEALFEVSRRVHWQLPFTLCAPCADRLTATIEQAKARARSGS